MLDNGQFEGYRKRMARFNLLEQTPVQDALSLFHGKWNARVIFELSTRDSQRFGEIRYKIKGMTNTTLSATLKDLENKGFVRRIQYNEIPPHVEYSLTEKGKSLFPMFDAVAQWAQENAIIG